MTIEDTTEQPIQDYYTDILTARNIWWIHITNGTFKPRRKNKYTDQLKDFPDLMFAYNNIYYFRECGIENRNKGKKESQWEYMIKIKKDNPTVTNILIVLSLEAAEADMKDIGVIR